MIVAILTADFHKTTERQQIDAVYSFSPLYGKEAWRKSKAEFLNIATGFFGGPKVTQLVDKNEGSQDKNEN